MEKKEFRVLIKQKLGLINITQILLRENQPSKIGTMNLNVVVWTPKTLNAVVAQKQQLRQKMWQKSEKWYWPIAN